MFRGLASLDSTGVTHWVDLGEVNQKYDVLHLYYGDGHVFTFADSEI